MNLSQLCAWQQYAADGVVIVGILIFAFVAAKKGFVRCFFGLISTVAALIIAFLFCNALAEWASATLGLEETIKTACINALNNVVGFDTDISSGGIATALEGKIPSFLIPVIIDSIADQTLPQGTTVAMVAGDALGGIVVTFIAWLVLFLASKLVLKLVEKILSSIVAKLPIVGALNTLLGFVVGALQGLLIISAIVAVLSFIPIDGLSSFFNECMVLNWLYNHNPINLILSLVIKK